MELAIEVGPVLADARARLETAGHRVRCLPSGWRVIVTMRVLGANSVRAQAHVYAHDVIHDFGLTALTVPPAVGIRDPDARYDVADTLLMLDDVRRAYDPAPMRGQDQWWRVSVV